MAMIPKILCRNCGGELAPGDKFCGSCGTAVAWSQDEHKSAASPAKPAGAAPAAGAGIRCPMCGQQNAPGARTCESCGNALPGAAGPPAPAKKRPQQGKPQGTRPEPLTFFQSWKFTAMIGAILVVAIFLYKNYQPTATTSAPPQGQSLSPNAAAAVEQIESLQREVDANPQDADKTLRLANMLHDVRSFPRAAAMYSRYLQLMPTNPDARVDLGTTYFELSMTDTTRSPEYLQSARTEMTKALTYAPRHQLAHFNLGIISLHDGNLEEAMQWFSKCVAIDSTTEAAKRAAQLLHQHTFTNPK